jgi:hypothetical protein
MQTTFQARLHASPEEDQLLDRWGVLYARVQHELFAAYSKYSDIKAIDKLKTIMCSASGQPHHIAWNTAAV